ncbi:hypothetical protein AVEN_183180-1 [Araneus ventricosus]|uniref:Uncharacterized protein n=1 Tax=Araneus ventricosus TaxID=182803 RepID=A0A4Y2S8P5_ARAVE|nr:hypothetical protein AVEN_183180-1 [Araneus ventricosus]
MLDLRNSLNAYPLLRKKKLFQESVSKFHLNHHLPHIIPLQAHVTKKSLPLQLSSSEVKCHDNASTDEPDIVISATPNSQDAKGFTTVKKRKKKSKKQSDSTESSKEKFYRKVL